MFFYESAFSAAAYIPDFVLSVFPLVFLFAGTAFLLSGKGKGRGYLFFCAAVHLVSFSCCVAKHGTALSFFFLSFNLLCNLAFRLAVFLLARAKEKRKVHKKPKGNKVEEFTARFLRDNAAKEEENPPRGEERYPQEKVLCYTGDISQGEDDYRLSDENVSLNHALGIAYQLKRAKLAVGDRLEADAICRALNLYRAKNSLTGEEMQTLNGYLATLLKLMAKYSL